MATSAAKKSTKAARGQAPLNVSKKQLLRESISAYIFLLPFLIVFIGFVITPMIMCLWTSFFDSTMAREDIFVGFGNYVKMFNDSIFWKALLNTSIIVVVAVPTVTAFSLWVASAIYRMKGAACSFFRCIFYLPVVTGTVAVTVVWKWMFNNYYGIINYVGKAAGIIENNVNWLGNEKTALWCIILILFTTSIGQPIVLYVSALGNVDNSLIEAAQVDGATRMQTFWKIMWPQVTPTTLYILVITTINSFQCFALIQLLTSGCLLYTSDAADEL